MLTGRQLYGLEQTHIEVDECGHGLHPDCRVAWERLQAQGREQGFELRIVSAFRSFERQLAIWNGKAKGQRPLLDDTGQALDSACLTPRQLIHAILRFSALPGASRHHWGSDLDIYDAAAVPEDYQVQLTAAEVASGGVFGPMHDWLDQQLAHDRDFGFFRPYDRDRGGVAPERWHLSYQPLANRCQATVSVEQLGAVLADAQLELKRELLPMLPEIYRRYVTQPYRNYAHL
ncbi:MAG: M15 family metallopeptidase [Halieaceae bacterium]|nr:M15 family metallopeptidase [Halieaceae bacterium]